MDTQHGSPPHYTLVGHLGAGQRPCCHGAAVREEAGIETGDWSWPRRRGPLTWMTDCWRKGLGSKVVGWGSRTPWRAVGVMGRQTMDTAD